MNEETNAVDLNKSVVFHSLKNKSNIISLSFDESDVYNEIAFGLGKSIKSTILLSTLLGSNNILGKSAYRKVSVKSINTIIDEAKDYFENLSDRSIKGDNNNYEVLENFFKHVTDNSSSWRELLSTRTRDDIKIVSSKIVQYWEMNSKDSEDVLKALSKNISLNVNDNIFVMLSPDLFLHVTTNDQMTGTLCNNIGVRILLKNLTNEV